MSRRQRRAPPDPSTLPGRAGKSQLPTKTCVACGREMVWRRAWARTWSEVRYCSERCRRNRQGGPALTGITNQPR